jgi:hypothetical protein
MGTCSRLTLLMVISILGETPPSRPPGFGGIPAVAAICQKCQRKSITKSGSEYYCRYCKKWFIPSKAAGPGKS